MEVGTGGEGCAIWSRCGRVLTPEMEWEMIQVHVEHNILTDHELKQTASRTLAPYPSVAP